MHEACRHLMSFLTRKSLGEWQRETLLAWVKEYISYLQNSPFSTPESLSATLKQYEQVLDELYPAPELSDDDGELDEEDLLEDFFETYRHGQKRKNGEFGEDETSAEDDFFEQFFEQQQQREREAQKRADELALKKMMKSSSLNKLFRKLAHALHPDRETDEVARAEKNQLMVELIQARDNNDIPAIFALY